MTRIDHAKETLAEAFDWLVGALEAIHAGDFSEARSCLDGAEDLARSAIRDYNASQLN